jgi:predicted nucleic acid-binding protein
MYLLDTDVLSDLLRRAPSTALVRKLASVPQEQQFTSSILDRLDQTLLPNLRVLPFDASAALRYGELRAELERQGTPVGDADLRIASIALANGLTVVTGNVRHFEKVPGLLVENWLD